MKNPKTKSLVAYLDKQVKVAPDVSDGGRFRETGSGKKKNSDYNAFLDCDSNLGTP
jgi:hypothetical protein